MAPLVTRVVRRCRPALHHRRLASSGGPTAKPIHPAIGVGSGLAGGVLGALCGVGGGLVLIPAFKAFSKLTLHQITATSMLALTVGSGVGATTYIGDGTANLPVAAAVFATASPCAVLGTKAREMRGRAAPLSHPPPAHPIIWSLCYFGGRRSIT